MIAGFFERFKPHEKMPGPAEFHADQVKIFHDTPDGRHFFDSNGTLTSGELNEPIGSLGIVYSYFQIPKEVRGAPDFDLAHMSTLIYYYEHAGPEQSQVYKEEYEALKAMAFAEFEETFIGSYAQICWGNRYN